MDDSEKPFVGALHRVLVFLVFIVDYMLGLQQVVQLGPQVDVQVVFLLQFALYFAPLGLDYVQLLLQLAVELVLFVE